MSYYPEQLEAFRNGSKTYYNATRFFPPAIRDDVIRFYGFVRTADNLVDDILQKATEFKQFCADFAASRQGTACGNVIIDDFVALERERKFDPLWADAFLKSMSMDLTKKRYETIEETLDYIYGSAEVIGLFMSSILGLSSEASHAARMQGRAMQMINFIRDVAEDLQLGRTYLPMSDTTLKSLDEESANAQPAEFVRFLNQQIDRYLGWQSEAETGYHYMPKSFRVPVKTASDMYRWTALTIKKNPFIIYQKKVKPTKPRILYAVLFNRITQ